MDFGIEFQKPKIDDKLRDFKKGSSAR